jgi:hypothetical protein
MTTGELRSLSRRELVERAEQLGVARAAALTKTELMEAIRGVQEPSRKRPRTWFGRARDLVARVVEQGLHLPNTAKILRGQPTTSATAPPPLPTVTLAEIYAAQGYRDKAIAVVDAVLERAPDHEEAKALRDKLLASLSDEERAARRAESEGQRAADESVDDADEPEGEPAPEEGDEPEIGTVGGAVSGDADGTEGEGGGAPPPRYDDVVALATDPRTAYLYWEVRAVSFARARWRAPEGELVLRVLSMVPNNGGVDRQCRDVPIDELVGDTFVTGLVPGSEVRFAVGWLAKDDFVAFAVAPELGMPRDYAAPVKSARRATMSEAAQMRAASRVEQAAGAGAGPGHALLFDEAGRRLQDYASGTPTNVVHFQYSTQRVRTVLRAGGASDMVVDRETDVVHHYGVVPGMGAPIWRAGGASDLVAGGASDLVAGGASDLNRARR